MAAIIDLYSRPVIGWSIQPTMTRELVCDALMMALWRRGFPQGVLCHSDRGSQYCSEDYQKMLKRYVLICSPRAEQLSTALHEIGHSFGLKHPFEGAWALKQFPEISTSFSIMNYDNLIHETMEIIPITPLPADIEAAQFLYTPNNILSEGNDLYHLKTYIPEKTGEMHDMYKTIASFWDSAGQDPISAKNIDEPVSIDIRPYSISEIKMGFLALPNINIENIIGGKNSNTLYLNKLDNIIDISDATSSILYIDPLQCGHDIIKGFKTHSDTLIIEQLPSDLSTAFHTVPFFQGTFIIFNTNNTIFLDRVTSKDITANNIKKTINPYLVRERTIKDLKIPKRIWARS